MNKSDLFEEISRMYDENAYLKMELRRLQESDSAVKVSPMESLALKLGYEKIAIIMVPDWYDAYMPKIEKEDGYMSFEEWYDGLKPKDFLRDDLLNLMGEGISFSMLKEVAQDRLKAAYNKKVDTYKMMEKL